MRINRHGVQVLEVSTVKRQAKACTFNFEGNRIYAEMCKQAYRRFQLIHSDKEGVKQ